MKTSKPDRQMAAEIVRDAGGEIVGRTKLQKIAFLLELAGFGDGFDFRYRHYGPYSEELAGAISVADAFGLVTEEEKQASWGGFYSIYKATSSAGVAEDSERARFARAAAAIGSIELELAATAAYLFEREGYEDPWAETEKRKPDKAAHGRLELAKAAYQNLCKLPTDKPLPAI